MDHFGIGAAVRSMLTTYQYTARQSGRTTSLVESVKNGDRIVFNDRNEALRVKRMIEERGVSAECIVLEPKNSGRLFEHRSLSGLGRTVFDHRWVEQFYRDAIDRAANEIDHLQRETSGFGDAHRETGRHAEEFARTMRPNPEQR